MSRRPPTGVTVFLVMLVLGLAALAVAAVTSDRDTAFSVDVPAADPVVILGPGQSVCQGPISVPSSTGAVTAWVPAGRTSGVSVRVTAGAGSSAAAAELRPLAHASGALVGLSGRFSRALPAGRPVTLCVRSTGTGRIDLLGSTAVAGSGTLRPRRQPSPYSLSLVFHSAHPRSVLSLMPTILSRASLFKLSWIGAWAFWVLLAALLIAGSAGLAWSLRQASLDDQADEEPG